MYHKEKNNHVLEVENQVIKTLMVLVKMIIFGAPDKPTSSNVLNIYRVGLVRRATAKLKGLRKTRRSGDEK